MTKVKGPGRAIAREDDILRGGLKVWVTTEEFVRSLIEYRNNCIVRAIGKPEQVSTAAALEHTSIGLRMPLSWSQDVIL